MEKSTERKDDASWQEAAQVIDAQTKNGETVPPHIRVAADFLQHANGTIGLDDAAGTIGELIIEAQHVKAI